MNKIEEILIESIHKLIENTSTDKKIKSLEKKHSVKIHFVPQKYRVFGGLLQSMNIQFGNYIEEVMDVVIRDNYQNEIIEKYSGKKSNNFKLTTKSDTLIDAYITDCQIHNYTTDELNSNFRKLLEEIKINESNSSLKTEKFKHDVDVLFKNKKEDIYYYVEIKYNDDHDTGKFVDINRKVLKTYAYLQRELGCEIVLKPILFYFNNKKMKGNIYLPEELAIYRGKRFFDKFTNIKYEDIDRYMKNISESEETIKIFNELYNKIVKDKNNRE